MQTFSNIKAIHMLSQCKYRCLTYSYKLKMTNRCWYNLYLYNVNNNMYKYMSISYSESVTFKMSKAMIQASIVPINEALLKRDHFRNKRSRNLMDDDQSIDLKYMKMDYLHELRNCNAILQFISKKKKCVRVDGLYHYVLWRENIRAGRNQPL